MTETKSILQTKTERYGSQSPSHPLSANEAVAAAAQQQLTESSYAALWAVLCEYHDGVFVLRGTVPSFHMKQLAQELVRMCDGVSVIVNDLEVKQ
jgi:osmotically-inducible protein OsmY